MVYACLSLYRWGDRVRSQAGLGLAGVLLVSITIAAGVTGFFYYGSSLLRLPIAYPDVSSLLSTSLSTLSSCVFLSVMMLYVLQWSICYQGAGVVFLSVFRLFS
jgi:hypothetical protein